MTDYIRDYTPEIIRNFFEQYYELRTYVEKAHVEHVEIWVDIHDALEYVELSDVEREAFTMFYIDEETRGVSPEILSEKVGITRVGFNKRIRSSLAKITNELQGRNFTYTDIEIREF